jgi:hypothetical protein
MSAEKIFQNQLDLLKAIEQAEKDLGNPKIVWYRGHSQEHFKLVPTLFRYKNGLEQEKTLFHRYRQLTQNLPEGRNDDWLTIVDMQHYGVPTRLLDWTDFLGMAVYFALSEYLEDPDREYPNQKDYPTIHVLDPVRLNTLSCGKSEIFFVPEERDFEYRKVYWENNISNPSSPIAIEPICDNRRVLAQKGVFTVHDNSLKPLEETASQAVRKVRILHQNIPQMRDFLKFGHLNESNVFPDIAGVIKFINKSVPLK